MSQRKLLTAACLAAASGIKLKRLAPEEDKHVVTRSWRYNESAEWGEHFPECNGIAQSPVDINSTEAKKGYEVRLDHEYKSLEGLVVENSGHSIQVSGEFGKLNLPDGTYFARQFHFHFPSEHTIDGQRAAGEMHIVHQKVGSEGTDDLAVIALLLQEPDKLTATASGINAWSSFMGRLGFNDSLPIYNEEMKVRGGLNLNAFHYNLGGHFYHYKGSLTTPPCSETVRWYVLEKPALVTKDMIKRFAAVVSSPSTNRGVQALNGRTIVRDDVDVSETSNLWWTYDKQDRWVNISSACKGPEQSPIDIATKGMHNLVVGKLNATYASLERLNVINNGHTLQVNGGFGYLQLPDGQYNAQQFHVHFPSEHLLNGQRQDGELHIVHQREGSTGTDDLAIVSILLSMSKEVQTAGHARAAKKFFQDLGFASPQGLPAVGNFSRINASLDFLESFRMQLGGNFYHYKGSLTTPPCAESVHWYVMKTPAAISLDMVKDFQRVLHTPSSRMQQPVYERQVVEGKLWTPGEFGNYTEELDIINESQRDQDANLSANTSLPQSENVSLDANTSLDALDELNISDATLDDMESLPIEENDLVIDEDES